jgi:hypothetical protein
MNGKRSAVVWTACRRTGFWLLTILGVVMIVSCSRQPAGETPAAETATQMPPTASPVATVATTDRALASPGYKVIVIAQMGRDVSEQHIFFWDKFAVLTTGDLDQAMAAFDLGALNWYEIDANQVISLAECESWAAASAETTEASLADMEDGFDKEFVETMLHPDFLIRAPEPGTLVFQTKLLVYEVSSAQSIPSDLMAPFFTYDRLNSCREAMLTRDLPPFHRWAVMDGLETREMFPSDMAMTAKTPEGAVVVESTAVVEELTDQEQERLETMLSE